MFSRFSACLGKESIINTILLILSCACLFILTLIGFQVIDNPGWQADVFGWLGLGLLLFAASFIPWGGITFRTRAARE